MSNAKTYAKMFHKKSAKNVITSAFLFMVKTNNVFVDSVKYVGVTLTHNLDWSSFL